MISFVSGRVAALGPDAAVIEVGGVGLSLYCTPNTLAGLRLGERAQLSSALIVREDSLTLYGFADDDERAVFELLLTTSGIGPRIAQAMLAVHNPEALRRAVADENLNALIKVPGIGRKGAQRIVLELKDRLGPPREASAAVPAARAGQAAWQDQVAGALLNLGWSAREAESAVEVVASDLAEDETQRTVEATVSVALRAALRVLDRTP
ncbi:MAG TPA: Holliday junction branch migration protein RuvA [Sporichthyaceae bacterium]|nr:Holliday junction branch migration protein RuvA [Sporichthyaceae bacterium]